MASLLRRSVLLVLVATSSVGSILSRQTTPSNYFCDETGGGYGTFSVYNTVTSKTVGCLDTNARWVVDGSCGVFNTVIYSGGPGGIDNHDYLRTDSGWCLNAGNPDIVDGYTLYCGPEIVNNYAGSVTIFQCIQLQPEAGLGSYNGHVPFSHRALEQPVGSQKVNITWQPTTGAAGLAVKLFWQPQ